MMIRKVAQMDLNAVLKLMNYYNLPEVANILGYQMDNMYYLLMSIGINKSVVNHEVKMIAARKYLFFHENQKIKLSHAAKYMGVNIGTAKKFIDITLEKMEQGKMKYLVAGFETNKRIDLLLAFTKSGSESVIEGLKHHLVDGYSVKVAAALSSSDAGSINRMLATLEKVAEKHDDLLEYDRGRPCILDEFMTIEYDGNPLDLVAYTKEVEVNDIGGVKAGLITTVHFKNGQQKCYNSASLKYVKKQIN